MPFTPFHLGAGILAKSVLRKRFSLMVFTLSQVLIDIEPGYKMFTQSQEDLHVLTHNLPAAIAIALLSVGLWIAWERIRPARYTQAEVSLPVLLFSAFFGTLSHLFLDGMYHLDMRMPQSQWQIAQTTYGALSGTEAICLMMTASGLIIFSVTTLAKSLSMQKMKHRIKVKNHVADDEVM